MQRSTIIAAYGLLHIIIFHIILTTNPWSIHRNGCSSLLKVSSVELNPYIGRVLHIWRIGAAVFVCIVGLTW